MSKKKIAILINSMKGGGAERVVSNLLENLNSDFDFHLVLFDEVIDFELPQNQKVQMISNSFLERNNFLKIISIPFISYKFYMFCKREKIDTAVAFMYRANFVASLSKLFRSKSKIIVCERSFPSINYSNKTLNGKIGRFLIKKLYPLSDLIIANSKLSALDLKKTFKIKKEIRTVYNPVDIKKIKALSAMQGDSMDGKFTFISIDRLDALKNPVCLIIAFSKLMNINCRLVMVGKGDMEAELKLKVKELVIEDKVTFVGFDPNPYKYLTNANCCVLSSNINGFPNVILEALSLEIPVISTDCKSGPREILSPKSDIESKLIGKIEFGEFGILTPVDDPELLAVAMNEMYNNQSLRNTYKLKSKERAEDFELKKILSVFEEILHQN